ncbi:hypothetical protein RIB2604_02302270 [Aspergillus luchuensis]|uniref:Uncharacterized protein n=1 Tax=Aspergillus kawachii TaxID=1069201 RepID=A0A146FRI2_ASPKA|nr:hypothetical protein RIB2604_02302270 [Aspergillus luchuensis]
MHEASPIRPPRAVVPDQGFHHTNLHRSESGNGLEDTPLGDGIRSASPRVKPRDASWTHCGWSGELSGQLQEAKDPLE